MFCPGKSVDRLDASTSDKLVFKCTRTSYPPRYGGSGEEGAGLGVGQ